MNIELRHIRYFKAVALEMNFRKASERLNMAQPALSRAIQQLEARIGAQLFIRRSRGISLTAAGRIFEQGCGAISGQVAALEGKVKQAAAGEVGELSIGYSDFAISGVLPKIISDFRFAYPEIHLNLIHSFSQKQIELLNNRDLDFGFLTIPVSGLKHIPVQRDSFVVVMPEYHPLADLDQVELSALKDEPFIIGTDDSWSRYNVQMNKLCLTAGFLPRVIQEAYNSEGIFGLISANMGLTIYPSCVANYVRSGVAIRPIKDSDSFLTTAVTWDDTVTNETQTCFLKFIRNHVPELRP